MNRTHLSSQVSLIRQRKRGRDMETEKKEQIEPKQNMSNRTSWNSVSKTKLFELFDTHINT